MSPSSKAHRPHSGNDFELDAAPTPTPTVSTDPSSSAETASSSTYLITSGPLHTSAAHITLPTPPSRSLPPNPSSTLCDSPKSIRILPHPPPPPLNLNSEINSSTPQIYEDPEKGCSDMVVDPSCPPDPSDPPCAPGVGGGGGNTRRRPRRDSTLVMTPWQPWRRRRGWTEWMGDKIATPNMVPALVMQAFSTGILDATTYADFSVFASNQTGNAIILSIGFIDDLPILSKLTGASFGSFLLGALIFGQAGHHTGMRRRAWLLFHVFAQACILAIAAVLVSPVGPRYTQIKHRNDWVVIALFAFMSGAQVAMARQSGSQELPTAPMTSSMVDLMADRNLLVWFTHKDAGPRNRRLAYVISMIVGAILGAIIHLKAGSWEVVVVAIFLKVVVFVQLALAGAQKDGK